jgi:SAM-dependent methyltransferase
MSLAEYICQIDAFNASQPNAAQLDELRQFNHYCIDSLATAIGLGGKRLLDIGASPNGYALERALQVEVSEYAGIGLDIDPPAEIQHSGSFGRLLSMNAERLSLETASYDAVVSMSAFEHISDVTSAVAEIERILVPGGAALVTFEPIWSCAYGHHLHHFGPVSSHMPDWAHLLWTKQQMLDELRDVWPADAIPSLSEAATWVYDSSALNRISIVRMHRIFEESRMQIVWMVRLPDRDRDPERLQAVASGTGFSPEDLMVKGLSVLLRK